MYLRSPRSWLRQLNEATAVDSKQAYIFIVPVGETMNVNFRLEYEMNTFRDILFVPGQFVDGEASGEMLKFVFAMIGKRYQYRWLMVTHDDVYINPDIFVRFMGEASEVNKGNGGKTVIAGEIGGFVDALLFIMCRDIAMLLSVPPLVQKLSAGRTATETLNRWLGAFDVKPMFFPSIALRQTELCQQPASWAFQPVPVERMIIASGRPDNVLC